MTTASRPLHQRACARLRTLWIVALALVFAAPAGAQIPVVNITAISPDSPARLPPVRSLYVRVAYESQQPLHFQAEGWREGRMMPSAMLNPSQAYPAGKGEAIAWVAFRDGVRIDEVRVVVSDAQWQPVTSATLPVVAEWSAGAAGTPPPSWVMELAVAQQRSVAESMRGMQGAGSIAGLVMGLLSLAFLLVPAYPVLQVIALKRLEGTRRRVAAAPLVVMVPTYVFCLAALIGGSNLWPIWAVFLSPPCALFIVVVLLVRRR